MPPPHPSDKTSTSVTCNIWTVHLVIFDVLHACFHPWLGRETLWTIYYRSAQFSFIGLVLKHVSTHYRRPSSYWTGSHPSDPGSPGWYVPDCSGLHRGSRNEPVQTDECGQCSDCATSAHRCSASRLRVARTMYMLCHQRSAWLSYRKPIHEASELRASAIRSSAAPPASTLPHSRFAWHNGLHPVRLNHG
jgi:hypothetical protein